MPRQTVILVEITLRTGDKPDRSVFFCRASVEEMAKSRKAERKSERKSRKAERKSRKQEGGKRKGKGTKRAPSKWNNFVKKVYEEGKRKDRNYSFGAALREASLRKKAGKY